jgi:molybdate transport system permease protein
MLTSDEWQAVSLTLLVAGTAVAASLPLGVLAGWVLAKRQFPGKLALETVLNLPLVLPPVVTGYLLLVVFGRQGAIGAWLEAVGIRLVFDWKGAALAAAVMGFPLLVRPIRVAFAGVDDGLLAAARTLGASPLDAFWSIAMPLARRGILGGCTLAFARAMGEFGATIMIAGSIPGQTRTMTLHIYEVLSGGGFERTRNLVLISIVIAAGALMVSEYFERAGRREQLSA